MDRRNRNGFTLVELLIAMLLGGLVTAAIYASFRSQHDNYIAQTQVTEMQQNLRSAMDVMTREIRMAGYDPLLSASQVIPGVNPIPAGIIWVDSFGMALAMDSNGNGKVDGGTDEIIAFGFGDPHGNPYDNAPMDGIADAGAASLRRDVGGSLAADGKYSPGAAGYQPIADNIQAVGFAYAYDANGDGMLDFHDNNKNGQQDVGETTIWAVPDAGGQWVDLDTNQDGFINTADVVPALANPAPAGVATIAGTPTGIVARPGDVRAVRVWILARASVPDPKFNNTSTYVVGKKVITVNDHYRRRLLETIIDCRNMGLTKK